LPEAFFQKHISFMNLRIKFIFLVAFGWTLLWNPVAQAQTQGLSLQQAVELSLANNPELKVSGLDVAKAQQQTVIARSRYMPTVSATAFANHYFQRPVFFGFGEASTDGKISYGRFGGEDQGGAALTAIQPIFHPGSLSSLRHARLSANVSGAALSARQIFIVSQIRQTYLQMLVLNERINLQHQSLERNRRALQDSRSLLLQGKVLRVDTLRAHTAMKSLEPELVKLTYARETAKLNLRALIGIDSLQNIEPTDSLIIPISDVPLETDVYDAARRNNPGFVTLSLQESLSEQRARQASSDRLPVVSLVGQYQVQTQANDLDYGKGPYPPTSYVGLQVAVPLFNGFSTTARIKQAQFDREQSTLRLKDATEKLKADVHAVVANCKESLERIYIAKSVSETARLSFNIVQYRYSKGVSSRLELTDSELALTQAQSNYLEAVYDYLSSRIALFSLMGKLDE
jgi:outer membrane protein TolC